MALPDGYAILIYRGHFKVVVGLDYADSILSAEYGGGYREDDLIFPPLHTAVLSYPTLHTDAMIEVVEDTFKDRLSYIWDFYKASKDAGNKPFLMKTPNPAVSEAGKFFLWVFEDKDLSIELVDLFMGSSGLKLRQANVRGLAADNADGSFEEEEEE